MHTQLHRDGSKLLFQGELVVFKSMQVLLDVFHFWLRMLGLKSLCLQFGVVAMTEAHVSKPLR